MATNLANWQTSWAIWSPAPDAPSESPVPLAAEWIANVSVKQIKLSSQAKDQLIRLKTRTGVSQWNILCRWAFCLSLRQPTPPPPVDIPSDSNVEMSWQVFGGEWQEIR